MHTSCRKIIPNQFQIQKQGGKDSEETSQQHPDTDAMVLVNTTNITNNSSSSTNINSSISAHTAAVAGIPSILQPAATATLTADGVVLQVNIFSRLKIVQIICVLS